MSLYIDFCFTLGGSHLVAAGWGLREALATPLAVRGADGRPVAERPSALFTHIRPDVPDDRAAGFVMVFTLEGGGDGGSDGEGPLAGEAGEEETLTFGNGQLTAAGRHTERAVDDFVAFAGDEPFFTVLREVAAGRLPPLPPAAGQPVYARVRSHRRGMIETPQVAAAIDGALADRASGSGLAYGWILAGPAEPVPAAALLVVEPAGVRDATAAFGSQVRPDLGGLGHRYRVDGRAGFVATAALAAAGSPALLVLAVACGDTLAVTVEAPEIAAFALIARRFSEIAAMIDPIARTRLRAGLARPPAAAPAGPDATDPAPAGVVPTAPAGAFSSAPLGTFSGAPLGTFSSAPLGTFSSAPLGTFSNAPPGALPKAPTGTIGAAPNAPAEAAAPVLLLEHDGRGRDLREVLGRVATTGLHALDLVLAAPVAGGDLRAALAGAARDNPDLGLHLVPGDGFAALGAATAGGPVVYIRSSMLMQSDVLPWLLAVAADGLDGRLAVAGMGRLQAADGPPPALAAAVARKGLPFAVALAGGAPVRRLAAGGHGLLTVAGCMLWAFGALPERRGEGRLLAGSLFVGDDAPGEARFADGRSPHEFDLETIAAYS